MDPLGNPVRLILTLGQASERGQANALIEGFTMEAALGDKDYDSDALSGVIWDRGAEAIIPPKRNRREPQAVDWHRYKDRNLVERFFQKLKQFRRVDKV